jgi:hypothetical protein
VKMELHRRDRILLLDMFPVQGMDLKGLS